MSNIDQYFEELSSFDKELVICNLDYPDSVIGLFDSLFCDQPVDIRVEDRSDVGSNSVVLLDGNEVRAESDISELINGMLTVNSDFYTTGVQDLADVSPPDVVQYLDEVLFRVHGFPESDKEKMLLIHMSRVIEKLAFESDSGVLRSSFQYLSRLCNERGTKRVYRKIARTDTDVHVYGVDDIGDSFNMDLIKHTGDSEDYRRSWFVVFTPDDLSDSHSSDFRCAALCAYQAGPNVWEGFWTFDPTLVEKINSYIIETM